MNQNELRILIFLSSNKIIQQFNFYFYQATFHRWLQNVDLLFKP
jgi:hypothetical protein